MFQVYLKNTIQLKTNVQASYKVVNYSIIIIIIIKIAIVKLNFYKRDFIKKYIWR